uniref:Serine/threonine-protein kinase polo (inferred by orthology to a D. melanogaster protein) n=1 Tax=Strongyloides venezuelensis TaxID=75913 RepID=A0A0K0G281_STRVS
MEDYEELIKGLPKIIQDPRTGTRYNRGELLGRCGFGKCYLFTDLETWKKYAGKGTIKRTLNWKLSMVYILRNKYSISLKHPNILRMLRYFYCSTYLCMTLELCDNTLQSVLDRLKVLDEPSCRFFIREVACGISYLHGKQLIHRDINPDNIFLTKDIDVKIGDFGIAIKHENSAEKIMEVCETITFLAPESIDGSGYSFGVDVWALGVTLYVLVVGNIPFYDMFDPGIYEKIKSCDYYIPRTVPTYTGDMIKSLFTRDPDCRPTINDILKRGYLSSESISKYHLSGYISGKS